MRIGNANAKHKKQKTIENIKHAKEELASGDFSTKQTIVNNSNAMPLHIEIRPYIP